ncbi:uncharacterized protein BXZ73DRAFT_100873 [Epithele typhae]|uniref:uncharacterized protein n=1 Tax=Epithele typhae TaxID=378194 RepID=UPI002008DD48|nr:uncharacterized protein BXZ73DRAFT_100873 [Epithele typhae]KAH9934034.1 hypothetical protein BXZ73DRAFT_100873 [Epithele typhae]
MQFSALSLSMVVCLVALVAATMAPGAVAAPHGNGCLQNDGVDVFAEAEAGTAYIENRCL